MISKCIRSNSLELLCDYKLCEKCKVYIDSDYYCEYKVYSFCAFKNIINYDRLESNAIANSLSVIENLNRIIRYISDDGSEHLLNFVTFEDKFILKAIPKCEQRVFLREKLGRYYDRVMDNSFLQHIYGVFKLTIKGRYYRLTLVENNPEGYISRGSIALSSKDSLVDQIYFIGEESLEDKFYLDIDLKEDFKQTLKKDLEYLEKSKIQSCKIFIDVLIESPSGNRKVYSGIYKDRPAFLSVRIFDVIYTEFNEKSRKLRTSGIEMMVDLATLAKVESLIKAHIS